MTKATRISSEERLQLRDRASMMIKFLKSKAPEQDDLFNQLQQAVDQTFGRRNLTGLKSLVSDLTEWCSGLPEAARAELNLILSATPGGDLSTDIARLIQDGRELIQAGVIQTGNEYRLLMRYRELQQTSGEPFADLDRVDEMLRNADAGGRLPD